MKKLACLMLVLNCLAGCALKKDNSRSLQTALADVVEAKKFGPYEAIRITHDLDALWVVYLHGYGGSGRGVYEEYFAEAIRTDERLQNVNWLFPSSYSWFYFLYDDPKKWQDSLVQTRESIRSMLSAANIDRSRIIWAGFSQGAITAADFVLHETRHKPLGLVMDAAIDIDSTDWQKVNPFLKGIKFRMTHDPDDTTLEFARAEKLAKLLRSKGMEGRLIKHRNGHTPSYDFISKAVRKLMEVSYSLDMPNGEED